MAIKHDASYRVYNRNTYVNDEAVYNKCHENASKVYQTHEYYSHICEKYKDELNEINKELKIAWNNLEISKRFLYEYTGRSLDCIENTKNITQINARKS